MGGTLSKLFDYIFTPSPTAEDHLMASVVVPAVFEQNLALGDGSTTGCPFERALQLDQSEVPNLYSIKEGEFKLSFQEHGTAYEETEASDFLVETSFETQGSSPGFSLSVTCSPVQMWGINFAGSVVVKHDSGEERVIYLPGTRTYDPAGITGDPHASERIGPSCSRSQGGITIAQLVASLKGAELEQINAMQEKLLPLVNRYHGRAVLFDWMKQQIEDAIYKKQDVTPYPEFIKALVRDNAIELNDARTHTKEYLYSYNRGLAHPPVHYYRKVAKKDKVDELFSGEALENFKRIVEEEK